MIARLACLALCVVASPLVAQDSSRAGSAAPFRPGQWTAHFALGSFGGLGVSRFTSPSRALLLQLNVSATHREQTSDAGGWARLSVAGIGARLGWRRYRAAAGRIRPYTTLGPVFSLSHSYTNESSATSQTNAWSLGLFGDLGALYRVTEHLGLTGSGSAEVRYARSVLESSSLGGVVVRTWDIQVSGVSIAAGVALLF